MSANPPTSGETVNILLVDDRPENLISLQAILADQGYNLVTAGSGAEALRHILKTDFALILLDVLMPEMDGFEVATLIKQRQPSAHIPIVFLTAVGTDIKFIYRGYSAGAVDYLVKPIDPDVVRAKVGVFVDLFRKGEQIKRQAEQLRESERRERQMQLAELRMASERRYHNLADAIPQIVWTSRADGSAEYFNQRWAAYTGLSLTQAQGSGWTAALHPDERASCVEKWQEAIRSGEDYQVECRLRRAEDGLYRWHLGRAVAERNKTGEIVAWLGTYTDIDDQKRAQAALDQFRATLDAVVDAVWIFDPQTLRFSYVNRGAERALDAPRAELLARGPLDVMPEIDEPQLRELLAPLVEGVREVVTVETVQRDRAGADHPVELSMQYIFPPGGSGRFVSIARDIAQRRRDEAERTRLYQEAQTAVRVRDEFLSIASHELKTPVTALQLQVKLLARNLARDASSATDPERLARRLEVIDRQVDRLTKLINNLLDISRITAGRIDLDLEDLDLARLVRETTERSRDELQRAGCVLTLEAEGPIVGRWDGMRLDQVVTNLLSNAVKYGSGKPIEVRVRCEGERARFSVRDHGIGIAPEDQARIFQRFERAVSERQFGGFGLGLWIVRQIVNALGGEIGVESRQGEGSTFTVELPLVRRDPAGRANEQTESQPSDARTERLS